MRFEGVGASSGSELSGDEGSPGVDEGAVGTSAPASAGIRPRGRRWRRDRQPRLHGATGIRGGGHGGPGSSGAPGDQHGDRADVHHPHAR